MRLPIMLFAASAILAMPAAAQSMGATGGGGGGGGMSSSSQKPPSLNTTRVKYYPQALIDSSGKVSLKFKIGRASCRERV